MYANRITSQHNDKHHLPVSSCALCATEQRELDRRIAAARARHPETGLWPEPAYTCDTCGEHFLTAWDADFHEESSTHSVWYTAIADAELEVGPPASRW